MSEPHRVAASRVRRGEPGTPRPAGHRADRAVRTGAENLILIGRLADKSRQAARTA
ncbi:MAG TPA: hypothetical protein VMV92_06545 [Streptosporangiaceae bacterium]|nr:hypothetical protein [Streptosporangiaceae bacterium]